MKKIKCGMIVFEDLERQDARKRKALKLIIRRLTPLLPETVLSDIVNIAKAGLKEK